MKKEAVLYTKGKDTQLQCNLCGHRCSILEGKYGLCGVRQNLGGALFTHVYGEIIAAHVDPIEKKPLYHYLPGSESFSIASPGCNFRCGFCQNWEISQLRASDGVACDRNYHPPREIIRAASAQECASISYTYTEPTMMFEYCLDVARLAKEQGIYNIFVTNGYMTKEAIDMIGPYLDAANIDLKFFNDVSYKKICAGSLKPVQEAIEYMRRKNIWVEVTTLLIPGQNDSEKELKQLAKYLAHVDKNMPWHISKFFPNYKYMEIDATADDSLRKAFDYGKQAGIRYVYVGNVYGWGTDTLCHACNKLLIQRRGFTVESCHVRQGKCEYCQAEIPGFWGKS
jgi:pyruvate formate lyase activating enzyme